MNDPRMGHTSASNAQADSLCPGRHLAQAGLPEPVRSDDADLGTRIHAALANDQQASAGLVLAERETFDACQEVEAKVLAQFFGPDTKGMVIKRHERYWVTFQKEGKSYTHSGEADAVFRAGTKALVVDYKVLAGDVAASSRNLQLRDLACLVYGNVPLLDTIGTSIIQPMVTHSPELCEYAKADLDRSGVEMYERVIASNTATSLRVAGEAQCKFCKAKTVCVEYNRWVGLTLPVVAEPVQQSLLFSVAMANWSPEQRAMAAEILPVVVKRTEEIKDYLKGLLAADAGAIPGWQLSNGTKRETIVDSQGVFDRFATLGGSLPDFLKCIAVQKGKLEESVNAVTGAKGKALKQAMATLLDGLTETKMTAPSLERIGDK